MRQLCGATGRGVHLLQKQVLSLAHLPDVRCFYGNYQLLNQCLQPCLQSGLLCKGCSHTRETLLIQLTCVLQNQLLTAPSTPLKTMFVEVQSPKLGNAVIKATCAAFLHQPRVPVLGNTLLIACCTVSYSLSSQGGQCTAAWPLTCSVPTDNGLCVSEKDYFTAFPKLLIINVSRHVQGGLV